MIEYIAQVIRQSGAGWFMAIAGGLVAALVTAAVRWMGRPSILAMVTTSSGGLHIYIYNREPTSIEEPEFTIGIPGASTVTVSAGPYMLGPPVEHKDGWHFKLVRVPALYAFEIDTDVAIAGVVPNDVKVRMAVDAEQVKIPVLSFEHRVALPAQEWVVRVGVGLTLAILAYTVVIVAMRLEFVEHGIQFANLGVLDLAFFVAAVVLSAFAFAVLYFPSSRHATAGAGTFA